MAFSSILRSICRKGFAESSNHSIFGKWTAGSWFSSASSGGGAHHVISSSPSVVPNSSPWLMLPPVFECDGSIMSYKFYSLAENKVVTLGGEKITDLTPKSNRKFRFRGSSHGWLALINPDNRDLFLYNPLSRRHLKLPPIHSLPNYPNDYESPCDANKVILSSSPDEDEEDCRAVMNFNFDWLAFCCPGRSKEWTFISDVYGGGKPSDWRCYVDCVYSARQKVFFCLTRSGELESWDLRDPSSPRMTKMMKVDTNKIYTHFPDNKYINFREHLVVAEQDLLLVTQYGMEQVGPDGSYVGTICGDDWHKYTHITKDFSIQKFDPDLRYVDSSSLGGLALFIGSLSHSVALPATSHEFPELKPNSIYFTDPFGIEALFHYHDDPFGGYDIGIFNYEDKTVSPCYYPCDVRSRKRIMPPPMWFFPSRPI